MTQFFSTSFMFTFWGSGSHAIISCPILPLNYSPYPGDGRMVFGKL